MPDSSEGFWRTWSRHWWIVLLVSLISVAAAAFFTAREQRIHRASTTMVVTPNSHVESTSDILRSLDTLERRTVIATFARIASTRETREMAAELLELEVGDLRGYRISASVLPYTNIIKIDVNGPDPTRVADVANAVAEVSGRRARRMYRIYKMQALAQATPSRRPVSPDARRNYAVAGVLGLFLGVGVAFVAGHHHWPPHGV